MEFENVLPSEIEKRSFEIIESELPHDIEKKIKPIVKRVIHTTADFDYLDNLCFSENVVEIIKNAIKNGADIVTDTQMARSGINKKRLASYGGEVHCVLVHHLEMVAGSFPTCSASHLLVFSFSASITLIRFIFLLGISHL